MYKSSLTPVCCAGADFGSQWRLRRDPTQKGLNGQPPAKETETTSEVPEFTEEQGEAAPVEEIPQYVKPEIAEVGVEQQIEQLNLEISDEAHADSSPAEQIEGDEEEDVEDDGEGEWITPSNIKKVKAQENILASPEPIQQVLQAALLTSDMAMRNVALRINLK
jgi:RNA-binding protein NOB1